MTAALLGILRAALLAAATFGLLYGWVPGYHLLLVVAVLAGAAWIGLRIEYAKRVGP